MTRSLLLDPRFQLKWTAYLVGVVLAVMTGLGLVIAETAGRASDTAELAVAQAERAFKESRTNSTLTRQSAAIASGDQPGLLQVMDESIAELEAEAQKNLADVRTKKDAIARDRQRVQRLLAAAGAALVFLLVSMGIVITNRIVGPVDKMKRLLRRVSTGRLVVDERLRRHDELGELFDTFLQMTHSLRATQRAHLATLESALRRAEASGATPDVLDGLRALRAQMVLGLEPRRATRRASVV